MSKAITYVGKLYAIQLPKEEPMMVQPVIIGIDDELGLVQAPSRRELMDGEYMEPAKGARGVKCLRLWYERSRKDFPNDRFWYHDLDDSRAYFDQSLDKRSQTNDRRAQGLPGVVLIGQDVEICQDQPGSFLCG